CSPLGSSVRAILLEVGQSTRARLTCGPGTGHMRPSMLEESSLPPRAEPLTRPQCLEVLRYWRAALRLEEALGARPRARRGRPERAVPRVDIPTSGQE